MARRLTTDEFIEKAKNLHNNKYDYSQAAYRNSGTSVKIICPEHGVFEQKAGSHLLGNGCPKCAKKIRVKNRLKNIQPNFIKKAKEIHKKYCYAFVNYTDYNTPIKIKCLIHGFFEKTPAAHLTRKEGCPKCTSEIKRLNFLKSNEEFIKEVKKIHGNKYNYSKVNYDGAHKNITIICQEHGEFKQRAALHLKGSGCPNCADIKRKIARTSTAKNFIKKAKEVHGNKYEYKEVRYINNISKVKIICPEHGVFEQTPQNHLQGNSCPKCAYISRINKRSDTTESFIKKAFKKHGDKYLYNAVNYQTSKYKIKIICRKHGPFYCYPDHHLQGGGCPKCAGNLKLTTKDFIKKAKEIHGNKYEYKLVEYKNAHEKVKIICPEHGVFEQTPSSHANEKHGCPKCALSGFNPDKPAILYYIYDPQEDLYKIGITNLNVEERFGKIFCSNRGIAILEQKSFDKGIDAYLAEQEILKQFAYVRCVNESWPEEKGGRTEFFKEDILKFNKKENR